MNLSDTKITGKNNLIAIANSCPNLERINFRLSDIEVSKQEMDEFAQIIGSQFIKCALRGNNTFMMTLFEHLRNIENISFDPISSKQNKQLFHLNTEFANLKVLDCNISFQSRKTIHNQLLLHI